MKFIEFDKTKCDECYKCLRVCPTKAIHFTSERREISNYMCIKCGICLKSCHNNALTIKSDKYQIIKYLKLGRQIVASVAPSFAGAFPAEESRKLVTALKKLGFTFVEETAVAADTVSDLYDDIMSEKSGTNILTSCCPSANYLVEHYYPKLIDLILPVVSPMIAHGRQLKQKYGANAYVVFIGPCLAKKAEAEEFGDAIDAVLTFNELDQWLSDENIVLSALHETPFDAPSTARGSAYPLGSSLFKRDMKTALNDNYRYLKVDGADGCQDILKSLERGNLKNHCIELNVCRGSCINGPDMPINDLDCFERKALVQDYSAEKMAQEIGADETCGNEPIRMNRIFKKKGIHLTQPSSEEISKMLMSIGKHTVQDQLNCGACGYTSCVDKAVAAINGISDIQMCLPYLRAKAESFQIAVFDYTPNLICVLDEELNIQYTNNAFENAVNPSNISSKGVPIFAFLENDIFTKVLEQKSSILGHKEIVPSLDKMFFFNVIYIEKERAIIAILTDITPYEKDREELTAIKERTISACQDVIDKQMRVAQEIASLLGETTAETKVSLNKLRDLVIWDKR